MTEENQDANDTVAPSNDTVVAGNNDDVAASGTNDTVVANEFSYNKFVDGYKAKNDPIAKTLEKFSSVDDVVKAYSEAQKRIGQGFKEAELPEKATPEQIKEYRTKIGVPDAPDAYKFDDSLKVSDADKPIWDLFKQQAVEHNISQKEFNKIAPAYYKMEALMREAEEASHKENVRNQDAAIKDMWGSDATANMQNNETFLRNQGGEELATLILSATSGDGKPLGNNPAVAKFLNEQARAFGYTDVMSAGQGDGKSIDEQINEITQRKLGEGYYALGNKAQAEKDHAKYVELIALREKINKK